MKQGSNTPPLQLPAGPEGGAGRWGSAAGRAPVGGRAPRWCRSFPIAAAPATQLCYLCTHKTVLHTAMLPLHAQDCYTQPCYLCKHKIVLHTAMPPLHTQGVLHTAMLPLHTQGVLHTAILPLHTQDCATHSHATSANTIQSPLLVNKFNRQKNYSSL